MTTTKEICNQEVQDDPHCSEPGGGIPTCPDPWIGIGELSRRTGVSTSKLRKWADERLIPCSRRPGENRLFPERRAMTAVLEVLKSGGFGA